MLSLSFRRLTFCAAVCLITGCSGSNNSSTGTTAGNSGTTSAIANPAAAANDPRENLKTAVAEAIRLLEAKEIKAFVDAFAPADWVAKKSAQPGGAEQILKDVERDAPQFLIALKASQSMEPEMDGENKATFDFKKAGKTEVLLPSMEWEKVGKYWRMDD